MSALDISEYITDDTDGRGRLNIGTEWGDMTVTYVVLDPNTLTRIGGPTTKRVPSDGRLSLGSEYAGDEVTAGIVSADE